LRQIGTSRQDRGQAHVRRWSDDLMPLGVEDLCTGPRLSRRRTATRSSRRRRTGRSRSSSSR